jgi:hypothetical protein
MAIEIRHLTKPDELMMVYRQRYLVYVEELGYQQRHADHSKRMIVEPLDNYGHIIGVLDDGVLVGSVRINSGSELAMGNYVDLYDLRSFVPYFPDRLSIWTKFIVAQQRRTRMMMVRLCKSCYEYGLQEIGTLFNFIDSKPPLDGYFRRFGYRQVRPDIVHPDVGVVTPMVLPLCDGSYLERIGSPFAKLQPVIHDHDSVPWFYERFADELVRYDPSSY